MAFAKAGLDRPFYLTDLRFTPKRNEDGKAVIQVTSHNPIRESYVNFLLEINWSKGRLMREYTLLLDPPTTFKHRAPQINQAEATPVSAIDASAPIKKVKLTPSTAEYKVKRNDNLWHIAKRHLTEGVSQEEMMVAIYRANPHAFNGHIDRLKVGQVLRIPGKSSATDAEARSEFLANAPTHQDTTPAEPEKKKCRKRAASGV
jgi:pilus assembly protein FimV